MAGYVFVAAHVLEAKMTKSLWSFRAFSFCMHDYHCNAGVATDQGICSPSVLKVKQWKYLDIHCITIASIFQEPPQTHVAHPGTAWLKMQTHHTLRKRHCLQTCQCDISQRFCFPLPKPGVHSQHHSFQKSEEYRVHPEQQSSMWSLVYFNFL